MRNPASSLHLIRWAALVACTVLLAEPARGATILQTYYNPFPENEMQRSLKAIDDHAGNVGVLMRTITSIVASQDGTIIYYDHWEDGYEDNIQAPVQSTTEIWGDNNPTNGIPPGYTTDIINAGDVVSLEDTIDVTRSAVIIEFDGGDKFSVTAPVAVSRAMYAIDPGEVMAGSTQIYDTSMYGTTYVVPVGIDSGSGSGTTTNAVFEYTALFVMAAHDFTRVDIDYDNDGVPDRTFYLDEGESFQINGGVPEGTTITSTKPIQVNLVTGDIGSNYEMRWIALWPDFLWADEYWTAVGARDDPDSGFTHTTYAYLFNPNDTDIEVFYETLTTTGSVIVTAHTASVEVHIPTDSGAYFYTTNGDTFITAQIFDGVNDQQRFDWGLGLPPGKTLTSMTVAAWAPGFGTTAPDAINGNPLWVSAEADTQVYVDFDADPTTGLLTDPLGNKYDILVDVDRLESVQIVDVVDKDQTGTRLYTLDGVSIVTAWGEDPDPALPANPYLDMGNTVLPFPTILATKRSSLFIDANTNTIADPGDSIKYIIDVVNTGFAAANDVILEDQGPSTNFMTYVLNSYHINDVPQVDDAVGTPFPLDGAGDNIGTLLVGETTTVYYVFEIVNPFPDNEGSYIYNDVSAGDSNGQWHALNFQTVHRQGLTIEKTSSQASTNLLDPGDTYSYTITVCNTGTLTFTSIEISDVLPQGIEYVPGTVVIDYPVGITNTVADFFDDQFFSNNYGDTDWATNWIEGGESDGPTGGEVGVLPDTGASPSESFALCIGGDGVAAVSNSAQREVDLGGYSSAFLSFDYRREGLDDLIEGVTISVSSNGGSSWSIIDFFTSNTTDSAYISTNYEISAYISTNTRIRFSEHEMEVGDTVYFDDVKIQFLGSNSTFRGSPPPILASQYSLPPGTCMVVRFDVVVDEPATANRIVNTACVRAEQHEEPICSPPPTNFVAVSEGILIDKVSSPTNVLAPGDTITYTIEINNTGEVAQTELALEDTLPAGVTYVPGSARAIRPFENSQTVSDEFQQDTYTNNNGTFDWLGGWTEVGETTDPDAGQIQVANDGGVVPGHVFALHFTDPDANDAVIRSVDLSSFTNAVLTLDSRRVSLESVEFVQVSASTNGVAWSFLGNIFGTGADPGVTDSEYQANSFDISAHISTNTRIRFLALGTWETDDELWIDDVTITASGNYTTNAIDGPADMLAGATLPGETNMFVTFDVTIDFPPPSTQLVNSACITTTLEPTPICDPATNYVEWVDLAVTKTVDVLVPLTNETVTYTILLTNNGPAAATNVVVDDLLPATYLTYQSNSVSQGAYNSTTGVWTLDEEVPVGGTETLTLYALVTAAAFDLAVTNQACVTNSTPIDVVSSNDCDSVVIYVGDPELTINKAASPATVLAPGDTITYTVVVTNTGDIALTGVDVTDLVPTGTTYVASSVEVVLSTLVSNNIRDEFNAIAYTNNDGSLDWSTDWDDPEDSDPTGKDVRVLTDLGANYSLRIFDKERTAERGITNLADCTDVYLALDYRRSDLKNKTNSYVLVEIHDGSSYTILDHYHGSVTGEITDASYISTNYNITSLVNTNPSGTTLIRFRSSAGDLDGGRGVYFDNVEVACLSESPNTGVAGDAPNLATNYTLNTGDWMRVTFDVTVDVVPPSTQVVNTACALSDQTVTQICDTVTSIVEWVDLAMLKTVDDATPVISNTVVFTIVLTNNGPADATNVVANDLLPSGLTYQSNSVSQGTYSSTTGVWDLQGDVPAFSSETLTIYATVDAGTGGTTISNQVCVTNSTPVDPLPANDCDFARVFPGTPDVAIFKLNSPTGGVDAGNTISYTIIVTNIGEVILTEVDVSDVVPVGTTYVPGSLEIVAPTLGAETNTFRDEFTAAAFTNNDGNRDWAIPWSETDINGVGATTGSIQVIAGELRLDDNPDTGTSPEALRFADLTGGTNVTLTYDWRTGPGVDNADSVVLQVSSNLGITWVTLIDHTGDGAGASGSESFDITAYATASTTIRFYVNVDFGSVDEYFYVDDLQIAAVGRAPNPGVPGTPAAVADGYSLPTNTAMTITFDVTVDSPASVTDLVNTACTVSEQITTQRCASVTNPVRYLDLGLIKTVSDSAPATNEIIFWTITLTNNGPYDATDVVLSDIWPDDDIIFFASTASTGAYSHISRKWGDFDIAVGDTLTLIMTGRVDTVTGKAVTNTMQIESLDQIDTNPTNNIDDAELLTAQVVLRDFSAYGADDGTIVEWETISEMRTVGFYLWRRDQPGAPPRRLHEHMLPAVLNDPRGGTYRFVDPGAAVGETYIYQLEEVETTGKRNRYGPFTVTVATNGAGAKALGGAAAPKGAGAEALETVVVGGGFTQVPHPRDAVTTARLAARRAALGGAKAAAKSVGKAAGHGAAPMAKRGGYGPSGPGGSGGSGESLRLRITITGDSGLIRLPAADIAAALGLSTDAAESLVRSGGLRLEHLGEQATYRSEDGGASLLFYAETLDSQYAAENVYWLVQESGDVERGTVTSGPAAAPPGQSFDDERRFEEDVYTATALFTDPEADYWLWDYIISPWVPEKSFAMVTDGAAAAGTSTLRVKLQGVTQDPNVAPDHHATVYVNDTAVGEMAWDGLAATEAEFSLSQGLLNDGANTLRVRGRLDNGAAYSIFYMNWFDIGYRRHYQAVDDRLEFTGAGHAVVTVGGFTEETIHVLEITDPLRIAVVDELTVGADGAGGYQVTLRPGDAARKYIAMADGAVRSALRLDAVADAKLEATTNAVDYLVISPPELIPTVGELVLYRQGQGLRTKVVADEQAYDAFSHGIRTPHAFKSLLAYAYENWTDAPRYVVLVGEGTYDYKNRHGFNENLLPMLMVGTPSGLFVSDHRLADTDNDGVPEMAVGRLPVLTASELAALIAKIKAYEAAETDEAALKVLMYADDPDDGGSFIAVSRQLEALLPDGYEVESVDLLNTGTIDAREKLFAGINSGAAVFNFVGHAGPQVLADEGLMTIGDMGALTNATRPTLVTIMSCIVGNFALPGFDCLAEALVLREQGGAVAVWSPSGMCLNLLSKRLDHGFFHSRFREGTPVLGDAVLAGMGDLAKSVKAPYASEMYNLLGDPATRFRAELYVPPPLVVAAALDALAAELNLDPGAFSMWRVSSDLAEPLDVVYVLGGTATPGADYVEPAGSAVIPAGSNSVVVSIVPVADGLPEGPETVVLTVLPDADYDVGSPSAAVVVVADHPVDQWKFVGFTDEQLADPAAVSDTGDPDNDRIPNLLEYALNRGPGVYNAEPAFDASVSLDEDGVGLTIVFTRLIQADAIDYRVEVSADLVDWTTAPGLVSVVDVSDDGNGVTETVTVRARSPRADRAVGFVRLKVVRR